MVASSSSQINRVPVVKAVLLALLVVLQFADIVTTKIALADSISWEMNPAMSWCMENLGAIGWAAPKLALVAFAAFAMRRLPRWTFTFAVSVYVAIVANNLLAILYVPATGA